MATKKTEDTAVPQQELSNENPAEDLKPLAEELKTSAQAVTVLGDGKYLRVDNCWPVKYPHRLPPKSTLRTHPKGGRG